MPKGSSGCDSVSVNDVNASTVELQSVSPYPLLALLMAFFTSVTVSHVEFWQNQKRSGNGLFGVGDEIVHLAPVDRIHILRA